jgi:hypothetical protein
VSYELNLYTFSELEVLPVRYELNLYVLFGRNSAFEGLITHVSFRNGWNVCKKTCHSSHVTCTGTQGLQGRVSDCLPYVPAGDAAEASGAANKTLSYWTRSHKRRNVVMNQLV